MMRTTIDIDPKLMAEAMKAGPFQAKKEAVEAGLRSLVRRAAYRKVLEWEGRLKWEGDHDGHWSATTQSGDVDVRKTPRKVPPC